MIPFWILSLVTLWLVGVWAGFGYKWMGMLSSRKNGESRDPQEVPLGDGAGSAALSQGKSQVGRVSEVEMTPRC